MSTLRLGLVHTPLTPFTEDQQIDFDRYRTLLNFHIAAGAEALALPMHAGESVSLSDSERLELITFAIKEVAGRVPVVANVTQSGTEATKALAQGAAAAGAAAVLCTTPYYWKPAPAMMLSHFKDISGAVDLPFFLYNAPAEMGGTRITTELTVDLLEARENFCGLIDISLDWQFLIDVVFSARQVRPDFQLLSGLEYMISAHAIGASGMFAPHAIVAPDLVRRLYEISQREAFSEALPLQEEFSAYYQVVKGGGVAALKTAAGLMGRDCGVTRKPLLPLPAPEQTVLEAQLRALPLFEREQAGWQAAPQASHG